MQIARYFNYVYEIVRCSLLFTSQRKSCLRPDEAIVDPRHFFPSTNSNFLPDTTPFKTCKLFSVGLQYETSECEGD